MDLTIPHSPQLNGKAERLNRTLMEKPRALLIDSGVEKYMWGEAVRVSAYLLNRSPTQELEKKPAELWFIKRPNLSNLQLFSCEVYVKTLKHIKKLEDRNKGCINKEEKIPIVEPEEESEDQLELNEEPSLPEVSEDKEDIPTKPSTSKYNLRPRSSLQTPSSYEDFYLERDGTTESALLTYSEAISGGDSSLMPGGQSQFESERESSVKRIQWIFIPPSAPWWAGFWERLVRVVKSLLVRMLGFSKLNYVQLETALCEVESIINNRALSYISEDDQDLIPLTPQMFLQTNANNKFPELEKIRVNSFTRKYKILSKLNEELKQRFRKEYLGVLMQRAENKRERCIKEGDLVLIGQDNTKIILWPVGKIVKLYLGKDGVNRVARVKTSTGEWLRPVQRLFPLEISSEETPEKASGDKKPLTIKTWCFESVTKERESTFPCFFVFSHKEKVGVIQVLKDRFGDKNLLIEHYIRRLLKLVVSNARKENLPLDEIYDDLTAHLKNLESLGVNTEMAGVFLYPLVESSLPLDIIQVWQSNPAVGYGIKEEGAENGDKSDASGRLQALMDFLRDEVKGAERMAFAKENFEEWEREGLIERIEDNRPQMKGHYLPHRPVFKAESRTTPLRSVFDASCRSYNGLSLNDYLEKGSNLFREKGIGVLADIRKAFQMITVQLQDQDFLRFLWWDQTDHMKITVFKHKRVVFGLNCSPFILGAVIDHHLNSVHGPAAEIAKTMAISFYMDNLVTSLSSQEEAQQFQNTAVNIMEIAKMDLREWEFNLPVSNSKEEKGATTKVLGLVWDKVEDVLNCDVSIEKDLPRRLTQRIVLSKIQQVFDPLGVYSPIFLPPKLLLQRSWELKIGWDSQLPEYMDREFRTWYSQIGLLSEIKIPRHIWFDQTNKNEIHVFCDASKSAYAAVAYMRSEVQGGVHLSLLWSKSRLAPTKRVTIPRLELLACVLVARLVKSISTALTNSCPVTLWTDSSTAMAWLKRKNEWNVFVRNRVQEIRDTVNNENWKFVYGKLNPADLPSRGCSIVQFVSTNWWEGPEWLKGFLDNARRIPTERGNLKVIELERAERKLLKLVQQETFPGKQAPKNGLKTIKTVEGLWCVETKLLHGQDSEVFKRPILLPRNHPLVEQMVREIHQQNGHGGAQFILSQLREKFWIIGGRRLIEQIIGKCVICRRHNQKPIQTPGAALPTNRIGLGKPFEVTGETIRLEIMGEELKEIKEKIEKLYDELFFLDEVDIDKESEACDSSMNKIGSLRVKIENERKLKDKLADIKPNGSQANIKLPQFDLPIYDGDMGTWINFKELFLTTIDAHPGLTNIQKLQYLNSAVKGEAARLIRGFPLLSENYGQAWSTLLSRYDNPRELAYAQVSKIFSLRAIKNPSAKCLHEFMDVCNEAIRNLETLELKRNQFVDVILVHFLQQKLSENLRLDWELSMDNTLPSYDKFIAFISRHARSMSCAVKECSKREETTGSRFPKCQSYGMLIEKSDTCILCKSKHHPLYMCNLFCKMPLKEKLNVVKSHKLCFNCLRKGHFSWNCRLNQRCKVCKGKHHTMIHYDKPSTEGASAQVENTTPKEHESAINLTNIQQANCNDSHVLLATAGIKIKNGLGKLCTCRALLDSGSQVTMITKGCCERLGLVQRKSDRMIIGVGNTPVQHSSSTVSVTFCPLNNSEEFSVEAVVTGVLTSEIPNFRLKDPNWPTLKNLKLADPEFYIQAPIDMILGADIYTELMLNGSISLREGLPMAINTRLGWVLLGKLMGTSESNTEVCNLSLQSEPELEFVLKRFWETESVPSPDLCTQDEDCESLFSNNHGRDSHGRYWVKLPFRQHRPLLGESREKALRRFLLLEIKLCKNVKLYDQYRGFMKEYEHLNHMERVPIAEVKRELCRCYYMPHHPVIREQSTTTKMRVVFDASAKSENNVSLNQFLHKGPKIQQDVFFILLRFRTYPVAITADIEKMYRQIKIHPEDADYQRILWRPSPEEPVVDYRLLTVTYGTTSAPFLAMRTLQQLAEDGGQNYPEASRVTLNDFYVDDLLTGAQTIAEAKELIDQLKDLMKKGGFHLRKWNSNCHEIVSHVEEMNEEKKINLEKGAISKILGIVWDHVQDTFRVNINLPLEVVTKRDLLSNIARIFDPLGFLSPTTVALKIIMQELWRSGTDWDEHIPNDIKEKAYLWSDSQISLSWIKSDPNRWKTFIHNRVVKIQQLSDRNSWRHVSGKDNPADCASRGIMPAALSGHTLWWQGPTWLRDNNFVQIQDNCYGRECHEEEKVALACQSRVSVCPEVVTKYSTFIKTRRIIAWCLRFITNCRVSLKKREIGTLSKKELENAVIRIIGWIQKDEFGEEMQDLRNTGHASRKSRILQLNPFIDASGMLRVGGGDSSLMPGGQSQFESERESSVKRIQWIFIPPSAPWWAGFWERLVRVVKSLLVRMLGFSKLNYVQLETALCEVESIINNRALSYISEDDQDLIPLTPQMFLQTNANNKFPELEKIRVNSFTRKYKILSKLNEELKQRFRKEYLGVLMQRAENKRERCIKEGDLVLIGQDNTKIILWPVGKIVKLYLGKDGVNRVARVKTSTGEWLRPVQRLFPLEISSEETPEKASGDKKPLTIKTRSGREVRKPI
ncbi:hypothetical protein LAZ67_19001563, partial [Cordylochernes scorpioides]